jgi:transcriptional regulator with XRE-family HTH domain
VAAPAVITSEQIKAARSLLRWEQQTLCDASKVSLATIKNIERKPGPTTGNAPTLNAIVRALEEAGVEIIAENGGGAGVRLKKSRSSA